MKSPKNTPQKTTKKPRENLNASEKEVLELLRSNDQFMRRCLKIFEDNHPDNYNQLHANLVMDRSKDPEPQTAIMIRTNLGFSMALGLRNSKLEEKEITIATIGFSSGDGGVLNIIGKVERKLLTLVPIDQRDNLKNKLAIIKKEGVGQIVSEVIYFGSGLSALNTDSYAVKISVSPGNDSDNPIVLCLTQSSKNMNRTILGSVRNFLNTADELTNLYREIQLREALMSAFSGGSEIMKILEDESESSSN